jgi:AcrR family transcriptional regulator
MASSVEPRRTRKPPAERRAEIVAKAAGLALSDGLEAVTLRRIADELGVRPGLVSHYFPSAEELVAEAFADAAGGELDVLVPEGDGDPVGRLAAFLARTDGPAWHDVSRLWLNARHLSRYRPALGSRVAAQEEAWRGRLTGLLADGAERGVFRTADPGVTAQMILVVLDGLAADAGAEPEAVPPAVRRMAVTLAERELGLDPGVLGPL